MVTLGVNGLIRLNVLKTFLIKFMYIHCTTFAVVVVDYRQNKNADTGDFDLIYKDTQKVVPSPPYIGVSLQVIGFYITYGACMYIIIFLICLFACVFIYN